MSRKSKSDRIRAIPLDVPACEVAKRVGVSHQLVSAVRGKMPRPPTESEIVDACARYMEHMLGNRLEAADMRLGGWRDFLAGGTEGGGS